MSSSVKKNSKKQSAINIKDKVNERFDNNVSYDSIFKTLYLFMQIKRVSASSSATVFVCNCVKVLKIFDHAADRLFFHPDNQKSFFMILIIQL